MNVRTTAATAAALAVLGPLAPASAAEPVHIEASEPFDGSQATFVSNLEGCGSGTVENGTFSASGSARFGIFNGFKHFTCADGSEFTVRLQARFGDAGSTGTWAFVGGTYRGNGTLVGIPFEPSEGEGITDIYDGTLRP